MMDYKLLHWFSNDKGWLRMTVDLICTSFKLFPSLASLFIATSPQMCLICYLIFHLSDLFPFLSPLHPYLDPFISFSFSPMFPLSALTCSLSLSFFFFWVQTCSLFLCISQGANFPNLENLAQVAYVFVKLYKPSNCLKSSIKNLNIFPDCGSTGSTWR